MAPEHEIQALGRVRHLNGKAASTVTTHNRFGKIEDLRIPRSKELPRAILLGQKGPFFTPVYLDTAFPGSAG